ncbi:MAG: hypothetical protein ALECFALPRED_006775, partial [Alectoria fallacina]
MFSAFSLFVSLFLYRYLRLVVNLFAFSRLRPIPIPEIPRLTPQDVTVVIPSIEGDGEVLRETIGSILATEPFEIILVTIEANVTRAQVMVKHMSTSKVKIRSVRYPNKRRQMVLALPDIQTDITVFADDDVLWPPKLLPWMLAPLEDESYGGVGTNQRLRRAEAPTLQQRIYGYLNALYLERRNFDCASCMYMDGGLPCLSGRTVAYRSSILKDKAFIDGFTGEEWLGRYQLNADDDNFITRWLVSHDKKIGFQYHKEAEVLTTLEDSLNLGPTGGQCSAEANVQSRKQPWSTYAVYQTTLLQWAFFCDCMLLYLYHTSTVGWGYDAQMLGLGMLLSWMLMSKFVKLLGHYIRHPVDFLLLPVSIIFGYLHGLIKAKAMLSLDVVSQRADSLAVAKDTAWGTRDGADDDDGYRMKRVNRKQWEAGNVFSILETSSYQ